MDKRFIGETIRELRHQRKTTGTELAKRTSLSQSKISRIETGIETNLKFAEIEAILKALDAPQDVQQQISIKLDAQASPKLHRYTVHLTAELLIALKRETKARRLRAVTVSAPHALLQTLEFRQALLRQLDLTDKEIAGAMTASAKRQDLLWDRRRQFHFIMPEAALYTALAGQAGQLAQLDRIERFMELRNIKIGIIPLTAGMPPIEYTTFVIYDESCLLKAIGGAELVFREPNDISAQLRLFAGLDKLADYGDSARALVRKALEHFS